MTAGRRRPKVGLVPGGIWALILALAAAASADATEDETMRVRISAQPLHAGRISPLLYGGFVELLDDLVPGMWAEMLNDRSFEGVTKMAPPFYYTGAPNLCDMQWEENDTWAYDSANPFNGSRSARLRARKGRPASLTQPGLAVREGMTYLFSGYFRADAAATQATVVLKTRLPDGKWATLGASRLPKPGRKWTKLRCRMVSAGSSDAAVFQLKLSGAGSSWADKLSLMPADNVHGWRRDVVDALREAQVPLLRWGGAVIDPAVYGNPSAAPYRWKNGIGDRDLRTPFPNPLWGRTDSNDVGIDEFLQLCEAVGAAPLVCMSVGDGAESARDLVEYCNGDVATTWGRRRAGNGHPQPYRVTYWQAGNEWPGSADYARTCLEFAKAIKGADAGARVLSSNPSPEVLGAAGDYLSFLSPHYYTGDLGNVATDIRRVAAMIGGRDIKLAVTEWNLSAGLWGLSRGKFLTLDFALQNARMLNLFQRNSNMVAIACRSNLTNSLCSGMIQTKPGGLLKAPSYCVMKLYAQHSRPLPLRVEDSPKGLDISACAAEDLKSLCVFVVNTSSESKAITLDLSDFGAGCKVTGAQAVCDALDMRQADVMNHWSAPDRVRIVELPLSGSAVTLPGLSVAAIACGAR